MVGRRSPGALRTVLVLVLVLPLLLMTAAPALAASTLQLGDRGPEVAEWQRQLNRVRDPDIAADGIFGPQTDAATRDFQRAAGIKVDGIVGPQTRAAMDRALGG